MAGVDPSQIDMAEVHDCFTITEILDIEDLGFVDKGKGGVASLEGETSLTGRIPINTSGGLLAKGHPIGATGVAQLTECWWQLRGEAGERQVEMRNGYALQHNVGGRGSGVSVDQHPDEHPLVIHYEVGSDHVGRITLDRPDAKNALTIEMRDAIVDAVALGPRRRRRARAADHRRRRRVLRGHGPLGVDRRQGRGAGLQHPQHRPRRCASACRRSSASSGSSTSRRSPR